RRAARVFHTLLRGAAPEGALLAAHGNSPQSPNHKLSTERGQLQFLAAAVGIWGLILLLGGPAISPGALRPFGLVTTLVALVVAAFDRWLWRIPLLHGWFVRRPNISGTWAVEIRSTWAAHEGGAPGATILGYMAIR